MAFSRSGGRSPTGRSFASRSSADEIGEGDGAQVALRDPVEDGGERLDRSGVAEVEADDRAVLHRVERALLDLGCAGVLVVERVHVEARDVRVAGTAGGVRDR